MATGDPYCSTHGYQYCTCQEASKGGFWVGDNDYDPKEDWYKAKYNHYLKKRRDYDMIYRPTDNTSNGYIHYPIETYQVVAHDRWSRSIMMNEELWDFMSGFRIKTQSAYGTATTYTITYSTTTSTNDQGWADF